jgi:predicted RND superfamily exporter protein
MEGGPIWRWRNLYKIVSDLAMSLGTASIEILIVMGIAFRSLKLGLIAIIPNMLPLAAAGTFMAILGWPLDIVSVCSFTICLGIAVDDTIHFLSRYREEQQHQPDRKLALQQAFQGVGTGMIMTTIVLVAGFSSVLISETRDHRVFGILGIITLIAALVCDLFLLPSLLAHFDQAPKAKTK